MQIEGNFFFGVTTFLSLCSFTLLLFQAVILLCQSILSAIWSVLVTG